MKALIKVTKALSDPNRVKIVKLLQQRTLFVRELQTALGISQSAVSKHLKVLENAGLVTFHKKGTWVSYRVANGANSPYAASIMGNLKHWLENAPEITELQARLPDIHRAVFTKASVDEENSVNLHGT